MKLFLIILLIFFAMLNGLSQMDTSYKYVKFRFANGEVSSEGYLRNGKPDGYWKAYYENGLLKSEGNRLNFELDSTWKFYDENGNIRTIINYKSGKKYGIRYTFLEDENIEEYFENDIKVNNTNVYYKDSVLKKVIPFKEGLEDGMALTYNKEEIIILLEEYRKGFLISREVINRTDRNGIKQGLWKYFYETGIIKEELTYLNGKKNGFLKKYDDKGVLISIEKYINDELQENVDELKEYDIKRDYYANGTVKIEGSYYNGKPDGIRREFNEAGIIVKSYIFKVGIIIGEGIVDENGKKQGVWKEYYESGELMAEGTYKDSERVGKWSYYHKNGKLQQSGAYGKKEKPTGEWNHYHENGQLYISENYISGEYDGEYFEYNDSGKVLVKGQYIEGLETGLWEYYIGDVIQKGSFTDGAESDWWTTSDAETGILLFKGKYFDGSPEGKHTWFYPNGKKRKEGLYKAGLKEGDWKYYNEDGTLLLIITYKQGMEIKYNNVTIKPEVLDISN